MVKKDWNTSLDEMLRKLSNGDFVDQSLHEFEQTLSKATNNSRTNKTSTSSSYQSTTYKTVVPHVDKSIESATYPSRYDHVINCLEHIVYDRYPSSKKDGYVACINFYRGEVQSNSTNLKPVENRVVSDMGEYKLKVKGVTADGYLLGYYDALLMIKRILFNSKLSRLQALSNRIGN